MTVRQHCGMNLKAERRMGCFRRLAVASVLMSKGEIGVEEWRCWVVASIHSSAVSGVKLKRLDAKP